jgi:DNA polymerase V
MYAIVDCNNFYASCERVFNPQLRGRPIVVLSNNDGNIIARSAEAKALGIKMGDAYFKQKEFLSKNKVAVFSSNYTLYGDMSARVMDVLSMLVYDVEVYSIDEAFLKFDGYDKMYNSLEDFGYSLKKHVQQWTGIPVSVGVAPTKTLAKLANRFAKKGGGVHVLAGEKEIEQALIQTELGDIWGIGRRYAAFLSGQGLKNAYDFSQMPLQWVRQHMSVVGERMCRELNGQSCLPLEMVGGPKKGMGSSRSMRKPLKTLSQVREAAATFMARIAEKLRLQHSAASVITVFVGTNSFKKDIPQYRNYQTLTLPVASDNSGEMIAYALRGIEHIYRDGYEYKRVGVMVTGIIPTTQVQAGLFDKLDRAKAGKVMSAMDELNARFGRNVVRPAAMGKGEHAKTSQQLLSPSYTTRWEDVITVSAVD